MTLAAHAHACGAPLPACAPLPNVKILRQPATPAPAIRLPRARPGYQAAVLVHRGSVLDSLGAN